MPPDNPYRETIEYLYALQKHGIKLALSNTVALMEALDRHRQWAAESGALSRKRRYGQLSR